MKYFATKLSENMSETPEGFLLCINVPIARTGEQDYGDGETPLEVGDDGIIKIQRDPDEVFRPETIASFQGKPLTIKHPEEFVGPDNWQQLAKGHIMNVRRGEGDFKDDMVCDVLITDKFTISLVKNGLRGLSCGYEAEYVQTGRGKGKQVNIVGNHLALVKEGRAGEKYAINDHKGDFKMSAKLKEKFKAMMSKVIDEATLDEDKDKDKSTDEDKEKAKDKGMYDELVKMCKDLGEKLDAMKPKDEEPDDKKKDEDKAKDDESGAMEERLKALEEAVSQIMDKLSAEESGDEDKEDESEDEAEEGKKPGMVGDEASRAEILAPGLKATKDVKSAALKAAYATKDGKEVIDALTGGKPDFASEMLFVSASELLKAKRTDKLSSTKTNDWVSALKPKEGTMTPEKMNEINAKFYKLN